MHTFDPHSSSFFSIPIRIYFEDTDAQGIVYHANYLKFFERARAEWLRNIGLEQKTLYQNNGIHFVVAEVNIQYIAPAKLDDLLWISCSVIKISKASIILKQEVLRSQACLAKGEVVIVCVGADLKPTPLPKSIIDKL